MDRLEREGTDLHQEVVRLNKYLALSGVGSRRKNDELILSGVVKVNGKVVKELGTKIEPGRDRVTVNGNPVARTERQLYILFNKPKDCITTVSDERGRTTIMDYVRVRDRVYPVGRLDRDTTGVLILTNDGDLAHVLTHPSTGIEKLYRVRVDRSLADNDMRQLARGVRLSDGIARSKHASILPATRKCEAIVTVTEGRNHLVKRMFEAIGYRVKRLDRIAFAGLTAEGLGRGKWRFLANREVLALKSHQRKAQTDKNNGHKDD
ncbi:MAG TPA: pseudouridine synthase [Bacteroidota bacterium]|nr:pseudouridine synthase [Bacteroidota bacterium]